MLKMFKCDKIIKSELKVKFWTVFKYILLMWVWETEALVDVFKEFGGIKHNLMQRQPKNWFNQNLI